MAIKKVENPIKHRNYTGVNNPHYGHKQSDESREQISRSLKAYHSQLRGQFAESLDERVEAVVKRVICEYLGKGSLIEGM